MARFVAVVASTGSEKAISNRRTSTRAVATTVGGTVSATTVTTAVRLVAAPNRFVTTQRIWSPWLVKVTGPYSISDPVPPASAAPLRCQR